MYQLLTLYGSILNAHLFDTIFWKHLNVIF